MRLTKVKNTLIVEKLTANLQIEVDNCDVLKYIESLFEEAYREVHTKEEEETAKKLVNKGYEIYMTEDFRVRVLHVDKEGCASQLIGHNFSVETPRVSNISYEGRRLDLYDDRGVGAKIARKKKEKEALENALSNTREEIYAVLASVNTTDKLVDRWPEIKDVVKQVYEEDYVGTYALVPMLTDLNKKLSLGEK